MGNYYAVMGGSRILNASRVDQSGADDAAVTGWNKANDIIMAVNINSGGKDTLAAQYKLRWRDVTDTGSFADLGSTGECKFGATDLINGGTIAEGGRKCDSQGDTWQTGYEVEGTALSTSIDLADGYETEIHFSVSLADGDEGHNYEFELYDETNNASKGTIGADITLAAAPITLTVAEAYHLTDDNDGNPLTIVQTFTLAMGADPYHLLDDNDGNPITITETVPPIDLVVAEAYHLHAGDPAPLTQDHGLVLTEAYHLHDGGPAPITQDHSLALGVDPYHTMVDDGPLSLSTVTVLTVAEAAHLHDGDTVLLTQDHALIVSELTHLHDGDNISLTQNHSLTVAAGDHLHAADNINISGAITLESLDADHLHDADNVVLTQDHGLVVAETDHLQIADNIVLAGSLTLTVAGADHLHDGDNISLTQNHSLTVAAGDHLHAADNVIVTTVGEITLTMAESSHDLVDDAVMLIQDHNLAIAEAAHDHQAETLVMAGSLVVAEAAHALTDDGPLSVAMRYELSITEANHDQAIEAIVLAQLHLLTIGSDGLSVASDRTTALPSATMGDVIFTEFRSRSTAYSFESLSQERIILSA